ncbi:hypothetical protein [Marinitoga sp. 38H-ov]|uniref:hypothetical protein n=1 Tax=Marinitoga sp. 38H-ov TaxID=1755814 RepID=UPI0013ED6DAA|nr:hypothetical protein [Marinitoga sp. 38H-ov]KAF2956066.1 hypothetical protein AS160_07850 [Marinitoga sp. 38H-ov]
MKKRILILLLNIIFFNIYFSNNIFLNYMNSGDLKLEYSFDFEATGLYVANLSFYHTIKPQSINNIEVSKDILNYLRFHQPGFSIEFNYKNDKFNDPNYFLLSKESFMISFENIYFNVPIIYVVSNGMLGLNFNKNNNNYFYWININNLSETFFGYYYGKNIKVGSFINSNNDIGVFLVFSNGIITISKNNFFVELINKNINLYFNFKDNNKYIKNKFYEMKANEFEINLPIIRDKIYFIFNSEKKYGLKFNLSF